MAAVDTDDDSFIVLGTSPGTSMDIRCNGVTEETDSGLSKANLEDAVKDLSLEASSAFKAHFVLGDCPSEASMMAASSIITDDKSTEELQKQFGELLDENVILKETLKKNNESMKEQFLMIASCQDDMMKTHMIHKEKFDETRELVDKLRQENKKLKLEMARLTDSSSNESSKTGPMSALEFVASPDDDTINKLTSQLDLVEKQRRQVIVENEKLTWQKESLEHIVDATSKERDDLKEKLKQAELNLSSKDTEYRNSVITFNVTIQELYDKLQAATTVSSSNEANKQLTQQLEAKIQSLQNELKNAQLKIFELENLKLELSKGKSAYTETVRMHKEQVQELQNKLKEAQTTVFQPVRFSVGTESESNSSEYATFINNVKLYDRALKHLAELLNALTHGASDSLVETLGLLSSLNEVKLEKSTTENFKSSLGKVKQELEKHHNTTMNNVSQVKSTMTILEGIFKDYNELLSKAQNQDKKPLSRSTNVESLTAALVARGEELQAQENQIVALMLRVEDTELLKAQLELYKSDFEAERTAREKIACEKEIVQTELRAAQRKLQETRGVQGKVEDSEVLKAQLNLYKSDFEAEREARQKMASDKENLERDLRTGQRKLQELQAQMDEVRKLNPMIHRSVTRSSAAASGRPRQPSASAAPPTATNTFTCPKCLRFSSDQYKVMEDHFDFCLDDF